MKRIYLNIFLCIITYNAQGMKRPLILHKSKQSDHLEQLAKRPKTEQILTPAEQQNRCIVENLNHALTFLDAAQKKVEQSNLELKQKISLLHKEVEHAKQFAYILQRYALHIDQVFEGIQKTRNYLAHYLANTTNNVYNLSQSIPTISPQPRPHSGPKAAPLFVDVETIDEPEQEIDEVPIEAFQVFTARVVPQKKPLVKDKDQEDEIDVER